MSNAAADREPFTIMISAAGRRVALMRLMRQSIADLGHVPRVVATDVTLVSAAFHAADVARLVPRYSEPDCLDRVLELCGVLNVRLIIPTIDVELPFYAGHRTRFDAVGTQVMVSSLDTIRICNDKRSTHDWLAAQGFPTARQIDAETLLNSKQSDWEFPLFVKPRSGSSSVGARVVRNMDEFRLSVVDKDFIVQPVARGQEYTVDVYVDRRGKVRCAVPRLRLETRGGEVTKGMTVRCTPVEDVAKRVAEALPGAWGVLNIQIFYDAETGDLTVSEINPRFGGGYPLSHQAGAHMTRWVLEDTTARPLSARNDGWTNGLVMLRYDDAVFTTAEASGLSADDPAGSFIAATNPTAALLAAQMAAQSPAGR